MILTIDINENDTARDLLEQVFHKVIELEEMSYSDPSDGFSLGGLVVVSSDLQPHVPWYSAGKQTEIMSPKETLPTLYVGSNGRVRFCYNSEWRTPDEMQIMADLLETALSDLGLGIHGVGKCLSEMPNKTQRKAIAEWGNCHSRNQMLDKTEVDIVSLFQKQVDLRGDAAALRFRGRDVSYRTFSNMIIIAGHQLRKLLKPGSVVMLHADGSVNWVVAMFAILWADCVFSPQGATLPHAVRTQHYAIAKAEAFLVPCSGSCVQTPDGCQLRLCVETIVNTSSTGHPLTTRLATPLSPAYICFSSGTTGHPKAILCTHSGVIALLRDPIARLHVAPGHLVAQSLAPQFDGALLEVFSALCYGGTLVLKDPLNPFEHLRHVDSLMLTPSLAEELSPEEYVNDVKYVYMAGEVLPQSTADRWAVGTAEVWNVYGPTETHILALRRESSQASR
jgi:non-ribosomal peptide synthetase component F